MAIDEDRPAAENSEAKKSGFVVLRGGRGREAGQCSRSPGRFDRKAAVPARNLPLRRRNGGFIEADGRFFEKPAVDIEKRPCFVEHPAFSSERPTFSVVRPAFFSRRCAFFSRGIASFGGVPSFFARNLWMRRGVLPFPPATGGSLEASGLLLETAGAFRWRWSIESSSTNVARERRQVLARERRLSLERRSCPSENGGRLEEKVVLLAKNGILLDENADFREKRPGAGRTSIDSAGNGRLTDEGGRPTDDGCRFSAESVGCTRAAAVTRAKPSFSAQNSLPSSRSGRFPTREVIARRTSGVLPKNKVIPKQEDHLTIENRTTNATTLASRLRLLNPMLRGWCNFYRYAWRARTVFAAIDHYVWWTILRWLRKKHPRASMRRLATRYGWRRPGHRALRWRDEYVAPYQLAYMPVRRYHLGYQIPPDFALPSMESPVHSERCTPGLERGAQKPSGASRTRR